MIARRHQLLDRLLDAPGLRQFRARRFDARFAKGQAVGVCRGIFRTHAEAAAAVPVNGLVGYDHDAPATMYGDRMTRIFPSDYPMLYWLRKAFDEGATRVFDLGGHIGLSYYAYRRYLDYPPDLTWQVSDVPAVMKKGREIAATRDDAQHLSFVEHLGAAGDVQILFTAGCLQYLEKTLADMLAELPTKPTWLIINLLPLHPARAWWTVQSIGTAFCPYRIQQDERFVSDITRLGYELVDRWENPEKRCEIAFEPALSLEGYHGMAFRRAGR